MTITEQFAMLIKLTDTIFKLVVRYPFGMRELNSYLIRGDNGYTVIDTGSYANESIDIWDNTLASGISIEKVVVTHAHPDHIGLAKWFQEKHHIPIYTSDLSYKQIQKRKNQQVGAREFILFLQKHGGPLISEQEVQKESFVYHFEPDGIFEKDQSIQLGNDIYETIWTPGHSPDHICFYHPQQKVMFIGDHVLARISPIVGVWSKDDRNPLKDYLASLEKISTYPTNLVLPGHGEPIENLYGRSKQITSSHNHRLRQALESVSKEWKTAYQVCQEIYGVLNEKAIVAPLLATITRYIYLESLGKIRSDTRNGMVMYQAII